MYVCAYVFIEKKTKYSFKQQNRIVRDSYYRRMSRTDEWMHKLVCTISVVKQMSIWSFLSRILHILYSNMDLASEVTAQAF